MTDFRITEADAPYGYCPTCYQKGISRERRPDGYDECVNGHKYSATAAFKTPPHEVVEKLPEEGDGYKDGDCRPDGYQRPPNAFNGDPNKIMPSQSISQAAMKPKEEVDSLITCRGCGVRQASLIHHKCPAADNGNPKERQTPTMTASDGKPYPMELFGVQQRFSDRTPPDLVDIIIQGEDLGHLEWMKGVAGKYDIELHRQDLMAKSATWTLAPTPAVEKVEPITLQDIYARAAMFKTATVRMNDDTMELEFVGPDSDAPFLSQHKGEL